MTRCTSSARTEPATPACPEAVQVGCPAAVVVGQHPGVHPARTPALPSVARRRRRASGSPHSQPGHHAGHPPSLWTLPPHRGTDVDRARVAANVSVNGRARQPARAAATAPRACPVLSHTVDSSSNHASGDHGRLGLEGEPARLRLRAQQAGQLDRRRPAAVAEVRDRRRRDVDREQQRLASTSVPSRNASSLG